MKTPEADQCQEAMEEQYQKLVTARAWDLVNPDEATRILPGKWVFDTKTNGKRCHREIPSAMGSMRESGTAGSLLQ